MLLLIPTFALLFLPGPLLLRSRAPLGCFGLASLPPLIAFILLLQLLPTVMQGPSLAVSV